MRWTAELRETAVRQTGYSWSGLVSLAKRAGHTSMREVTLEQLIAIVRAHLEPPARPAPTSVIDTLGRVRRVQS
jgi:hypothetical protein